MSRPNPAQEPSMDEILASIRKIIAEDPVGSTRESDDAPAAPLSAPTRAHADPGEFELPSVFKPKPTAPERSSLFGRLSGVTPSPAPSSQSSASSASLPASSSGTSDARSKAVDAEISDLVESDLGDLLAETPAVLPPPAPGVPPGAVTHPIFPPVELLSVEPEAAAPAPSAPAPAALKSRLEERLANLGSQSGRDYLGNEMGRNEPAAAPLNARTKDRDEAIATALGSLIPTKAEQANPASRLPPLGPLNESSAFSAIRPGAPSPHPSAPSGLTAGGWPRAQIRQPEPVEAPKPRAEDASQKRVEPVILAAMPVAKAAAEPPKPASPFGDSPALDASPREVKTAPVVLASQPNIAERYSKPEVLASMPAMRPAGSEGPSIRVEAETIKPDVGRGRPEILAAMPKPAAPETSTSVSASRHPAVGLLPPLKPVDAPAGAKVGEVAPISTAVEEPRQADEVPKAAAEEAKPAIEEESAFDAISALGALAAGLAKSSSAPVVALAAVEEVKKTLPQAVNTADVESPPGPSIEVPVVRAGQASYAPVKPKLPEAPKFLAPAPAPTAEAAPVDFPPAALETPPLPAPPLPASPVVAAVEPQVDALAMLSAAMGTANPDSAKAPAGIPVPPVLPLSAMLNSSAEPEDTPERTLEDTVAELLRPMLRQWLSDNMPRIVEKALRIEVAQSLRPGGKTRS